MFLQSSAFITKEIVRKIYLIKATFYRRGKFRVIRRKISSYFETSKNVVFQKLASKLLNFLGEIVLSSSWAGSVIHSLQEISCSSIPHSPRVVC